MVVLFRTVSNNLGILGREFQFPIQEFLYEDESFPEKMTSIKAFDEFGVLQMETQFTYDVDGKMDKIKYYFINKDGVVDTEAY